MTNHLIPTSSQLYQTMFHGKTLLPVIHVKKVDQMLRNLQIAKDAGADGVFLINHSPSKIPYMKLLELHAIAVSNFPGWWIGVNCLDLSSVNSFRYLNDSVDGVWVDNGGIDENNDSQVVAKLVKEIKNY